MTLSVEGLCNRDNKKYINETAADIERLTFKNSRYKCYRTTMTVERLYFHCDSILPFFPERGLIVFTHIYH